MRVSLLRSATGEKLPVTTRERRAAALYRPHYAELVRKFCLLGAGDNKLAELFEVEGWVLVIWRNLYPEFQEAISSGRHIADAEVVNSMYKHAVGYSHPAVKIMASRDPNGGVEVIREEYTEHYPPNQAAAEFILTNRHPDKWRKQQQLDVRSVSYVGVLDQTDSKL